MNHSFNIEDAKTYGVNCAVILENIRFWVAKNKANGKHNYDGKYWTYNSIKAFHELFPYLSERQIRTALDKLIEAGEIEKGNYNQNSYDQTTWYTCVKSICQESQIQLTSESNGSGTEVKCIIGTDINTDVNHIEEEKFLHKQLESNTTTKNLRAPEWMSQIPLDGDNSWRYIHRQVKGNKPEATLAELKNKCTLFTEQEKGTSTRHEWTKHFINWCKYQKFTPKKESSIPSATHSDWKK